MAKTNNYASLKSENANLTQDKQNLKQENGQLRQENESLKQQVKQLQNKEQVTNVEIYNLNQHMLELERTKADLQVTINIVRDQLKQLASTNK